MKGEKMDFILLITSEKNADKINMVRGDKRFVQKSLEQICGFSSLEQKNLFIEGHCEFAGRKYTLHENFNSIRNDIESLKTIQRLLLDIARFQTGEHVTILRDAVIRIEKTIQSICDNFSE